MGLHQEEAAGRSSGETPCKGQKSMSTELTSPKGVCGLPETQMWDVAERLRLVQYELFQSTWTPRMLLEGDLGCIKSAYAALGARVRDIKNPGGAS